MGTFVVDVQNYGTPILDSEAPAGMAVGNQLRFTLTGHDDNVITDAAWLIATHSEGWWSVSRPITFGTSDPVILQKRLLGISLHAIRSLGAPVRQILAEAPRHLYGAFTDRLTAAETRAIPPLLRSRTSAVKALGRKRSPRHVCFDEGCLPDMAETALFLEQARPPATSSAVDVSIDGLAQRARSILSEAHISAIHLDVRPLRRHGEGRMVWDWLRENGGLAEIDGVCVCLSIDFGSCSHIVGGARVYELRMAGDGWYLLADPVVPPALKRNNLHMPLVHARILYCLNVSNASPNRIIWAPGKYWRKAVPLGLREMQPHEYANAPKALHKLAERSRQEALAGGDVLASGLYCLDEARVVEIQGCVDGVTDTSVVMLRGKVHEANPHVPRITQHRLLAAMMKFEQLAH